MKFKRQERAMTAYVVSEISRVDQNLIEEYRALAGPSVESYGGRYLARGGAIEPVEGDFTSKGLVLLEFPSMEQARQWYASPEYRKALEVANRALSRRLIFIEGL
jgi:uncharacterized protein (DUF1330 family)